MGNVLRFWFLAELLIYKTILLFWWRISIALEFRSQCHIFRFGNIAYCYEIDIFLTKTLLIVARSAYSLTKTLPIVARLAYSRPKHCLLLRDWHILDQDIAYCCEIDVFLTPKSGKRWKIDGRQPNPGPADPPGVPWVGWNNPGGTPLPPLDPPTWHFPVWLLTFR